MRASYLVVSALAAAALSAACQHKAEAPPLSGPSSLSTTLNVTATPDSISQDGAAQSSVQVQAIGPDGRPMSGVAIRLDMSVDGVLFDYGTLSSKSIVTGSDGIARAVYTAPPAPPASSSGTVTRVVVSAYPVGNDAQTTHAFETQIRLMPIGVILPPAEAPVPAFTISPQPVTLNVPATFDASASTPGSGSSSITSYQWNFGDGGTASGRVVTHTYTTTGTFSGTLTVTNDRGVSASVPIAVTLGGDSSDAFTGDWITSPAGPIAGQAILFNADAVRTTPGHQVTVFNWNFGDLDTTQPTSGFLVTHTFANAGTYNVVLSVQDDLGRRKVFPAKPVTVTSGNPVASFTTSVANPLTHTITFDGSASAAVGGATIVSYQWSFGDGSSSGALSGPVTSHPYAAAASYTVRLTVTDSLGRTGTFQASVAVP
jgi:PKD repeat protein